MDSVIVDAGVDPRVRLSASTPSTVKLDAICFGAVMACAAAIAWSAAGPFIGHVPDQNALYSADTGRVFAYLTNKTDGYFRMKVHPLYGWLCIFYQFVVMKVLHVPPRIGIPALSGTIAVGCCALLYAVMRRLQIAPLTAASFCVLFCSSATFVFWSSLPETHMLAGASVLAAVLLMTGRQAARGKMWTSAVALMTGFSMVVTDGMVWVLKQIDFAPLRRGDVRAFLRGNFARVRPLTKIFLLGVGLTFLVWSPEWPILGKRVGIPFNFLEERHYVELQSSNSLLSIHIFGLTPPQIPFAWLVPLLCVAATVASLFVIRTRQWFIPLFVLFGLALHLVYSGDCAFLFSPDYMPLFIVTLALAAKEKLPPWIPLVVLPVAAGLLILNFEQWHLQMQAIDAAGQMKTFDTVTLH